jgi:hypothetical protein
MPVLKSISRIVSFAGMPAIEAHNYSREEMHAFADDGKTI